MGRTLIIKNSDFSENAIDNSSIPMWLYQIPAEELQGADELWGSASHNYCVGNQEYLGMTVTKIRFKAAAAGTLMIRHADNETPAPSNLTTLANVEVTSEDVGNVVEKSVSFVVPTTGWIAMKVSAQGLISTYKNNSRTPYVPVWSTTGASKLAGYDANVDFYGSWE